MTELISNELQSKFASWRMKAAAGELSLEEMREGIRFLRQGRMAAASTAGAAKSRTKKSAAPAADDMLGELENL